MSRHATPVPEAAFNELWQAHRGIVVRLARYYAARPEDAEDLIQEVAVQLWRALPGFRGESKLSTWVYRVALNTCLSIRRKKNLPPTALEAAAQVADTADITASLDQAALLDQVKTLAQTFKSIDQTLLLLLLEGLSYEEMADVTGLTVNYVGVRLTRIRTRLKETLTP
ncbi:MAG: sigma-70 family RNA polymerase sigma factor [Bacteroidia bacterium]|jgi:RNA polymerase sigma-70 factor (ECF subfamily)|nr:sigma-70 family RNA polymerase sigma factor [Bacteroidia bacterium]